MKQTLVKSVGLIILLVVMVFAIDAVAGPFFSLSTQSWGPERRGDKLMGIVEGHLKSTDVATHTVRITSGFLGLDSLSLEVTTDTVIGVNGKLGGFGDLDRGQLVRVAYEVASDRRVASRVEVLNAGSATALTATPTWALSEDTPADRPASDAGVATPPAIEPVEAAPVAVPTADAPTPAEASAPVVGPPANTDADRGEPARLGEAASPSPRASTKRARRPDVRTAPAASPRPAAPSSPPSVSRSTARTAADATPPRREAEDAGAVIDWLLNSSPARGQ